MRIYLFGLMILLLVFGYVQGRIFQVPAVISQFSDGGVEQYPDSIFVTIIDQGLDTLIVDTLTDTTSSEFSNHGFVKYYTCTTSYYSVSMEYDVFFPSGNSTELQDRYEMAYRPDQGLANYVVWVRDTSGTSEFVEDAKVTIRYPDGDYQSHLWTGTGGAATFSLDSGGVYLVYARKNGYYFPTVTDTVLSNSVLLHVNGYDTDSTTLCRVYTTLDDIGASAQEYVRVEAEVQGRDPVRNICDSTHVVVPSKTTAYSGADGEVEMYLVRSACLEGSNKYKFTAYVGNRTVRLGRFTVPAQSEWQIGADSD